MVQAGGMESHTIFNLLRKWQNFALLEAELKTGRTHQIRVHLASSGFPILGDEKYGDFALNKQLQKADATRGALRRMFLHAYKITFTHPETGKPMTLQRALACGMRPFLVKLRASNLQLNVRSKPPGKKQQRSRQLRRKKCQESNLI